MVVSQTIEVSPSARSFQRSSGGLSLSATARITERMSKGCLRSALSSAENRSPMRRNGLSASAACGLSADVAVGRIAGRAATREAFARHHVGQVVVPHQQRAGRREGRRPVLRLAVQAHHAVVAADAEVVLGTHGAGEVERLLAGEHHRRGRRHDQDAARVHQHRRLGVPVRLAADVDAGDDDVDLAAGLGELDQPAQRQRDPVHVLGARVHGDERAAAHREPLHRQPVLGRVGQRGIDAPAFRFGQVAQPLGRVGQQHHALMPSGTTSVGLLIRPTTRWARVRSRLALHRHQSVVGVEVEFLEDAGRQAAAGTAAGEQASDLVRIGRAEARRGQQLLLVARRAGAPARCRRGLRSRGRVADVLELQHRIAQAAGGGVVGDAHLDHQLLQAGPCGQRGKAARQRLDLRRQARSTAHRRRAPGGWPPGGRAGRSATARCASPPSPAGRCVRCAGRSPRR